MSYRQNPDVISRREGNKTLVFFQRGRQLCILNPTSTFIWEHCREERTAEEIAMLLADHFEIPAEHSEPQHLLSLVTDHLSLLERVRLLESATA
jgi:hypothetical protein